MTLYSHGISPAMEWYVLHWYLQWHCKSIYNARGCEEGLARDQCYKTMSKQTDCITMTTHCVYSHNMEEADTQVNRHTWLCRALVTRSGGLGLYS